MNIRKMIVPFAALAAALGVVSHAGAQSPAATSGQASASSEAATADTAYAQAAAAGQATAPASDSLSFASVVQQVISNYPSIKKAEYDIEAANARIGLARSAYYPSLDVSASYSHLAPVSTFDLSALGLGVMALYPANNYDAGLDLNQKIYDFGKTSGNVELQKRYMELSQLSTEQIKQQLSLSLVGNYYSMLYIQEAIAIKDEELATLGEHLAFVQKQLETGSATEFAILSTKVRISATQTQKTDLEASLEVLQAELNAFMGAPQQNRIVVREELSGQVDLASGDKLISDAMTSRDELKIAEQNTQIASARYKIAGSSANPDLNFFASGGWKNGYIPDENKFKANYVVGVGFRLPIFNGWKVRYDKAQAQADISSSQQDTELTGRNITSEVISNRANVEAAAKKIAQQELQLEQATSAYDLARTSFQAGTITNLDLLDSATSLSESRLALMKSRIDYTVSLMKLRVSTGERIY